MQIELDRIESALIQARVDALFDQVKNTPKFLTAFESHKKQSFLTEAGIPTPSVFFQRFIANNVKSPEEIVAKFKGEKL